MNYSKKLLCLSNGDVLLEIDPRCDVQWGNPVELSRSVGWKTKTADSVNGCRDIDGKVGRIMIFLTWLTHVWSPPPPTGAPGQVSLKCSSHGFQSHTVV